MLPSPLLRISIFLKLTPLDFQSNLPWPSCPLEIHIFPQFLVYPWNLNDFYSISWIIPIVNRRGDFSFLEKPNQSELKLTEFLHTLGKSGTKDKVRLSLSRNKNDFSEKWHKFCSLLTGTHWIFIFVWKKIYTGLLRCKNYFDCLQK